MISTVLVPLDRSGTADRALSYGLVVARATSARLVLLGTTSGVASTRFDQAWLEARTEEVRTQGIVAEAPVCSAFSWRSTDQRVLRRHWHRRVRSLTRSSPSCFCCASIGQKPSSRVGRTMAVGRIR
jgi:hypothetical protein